MRQLVITYSLRILACIWAMKISEQNDARNNIN